MVDTLPGGRATEHGDVPSRVGKPQEKALGRGAAPRRRSRAASWLETNGCNEVSSFLVLVSHRGYDYATTAAGTPDGDAVIETGHI